MSGALTKTTVTTSATLLLAAATRGPREVSIENPSSSTTDLLLDATSGVTATAYAVRVPPGTSHRRVYEAGETVYGIVASGTVLANVVDLAQRVQERVSADRADEIVRELWIPGDTAPRLREYADGRRQAGPGSVQPQSEFAGAWGVIATGDPKEYANNLLTLSANRAYYMRVNGAGTVSKIGVHVGTSSGNICVGAYRNSGVGRAARPATRLATSGSVACPTGTSYSEVALGGSVDLLPGDWLALAADNTTATFAALTLNNSSMYDGIVHMQDTAFPLPASATPASTNNRALFLVGVP